MSLICKDFNETVLEVGDNVMYMGKDQETEYLDEIEGIVEKLLPDNKILLRPGDDDTLIEVNASECFQIPEEF